LLHHTGKGQQEHFLNGGLVLQCVNKRQSEMLNNNLTVSCFFILFLFQGLLVSFSVEGLLMSGAVGQGKRNKPEENHILSWDQILPLVVIPTDFNIHRPSGAKHRT